MKKILGILMMVVAMMTVSTSVCAQAPNQKQRLSREQLAESRHNILLTIWVLMTRPVLNLSTPIPSSRKRFGH